MGLLDPTDDPRTMGLLSLGLGLLGSKGSFGNALSQAGPQALQAMRQVQIDKQRRAQMEQAQKLQGLQMQQANLSIAEQQRAAAERQKLSDLAAQSVLTPDQVAMRANGGPTVAASQAATTAAPDFDWKRYTSGVAGINPMMALQIQQSMRKEQPKLSKLEQMRDPQGRMVNVAVFEDGSSKVLPFGVKPEIALQNLGNRVVAIDKNSTSNGASFGIGTSPDTIYQGGITMRGQNLTDARSREANDINKQAARVQVINDPIRGPLLVDKGNGLVRSAVGLDGKPIKGEETVKAEKRTGQMLDAINVSRELLEKGPTGSFAGAGVDMALRVPGISTKGGDVAGQLEAVAGWLTANVPRMEGPQSNIDMINYQTMAARVGDRTRSVKERMAALDVVEDLQRKYAGMPARVQAKTGVDLFKAADAIIGSN